MTSLFEQMTRSLRRDLVGRQITCPLHNTRILDVDTAVFFVDPDGFPVAVMSQEGYAELRTANPERLETLKERSIVVDESTLNPRVNPA